MDLLRPLILWAAPRSLSTVFERVFIERSDFDVWHEPFADTYYFGPERRSSAFSPRFPHQVGKSHHEIVADMLGPRPRRLFVKEMAYHTLQFMDRELMARFENVFIIRNPRASLPSLYALNPSFTFEETGYAALYLLYGFAKQAGQSPIVIDADDLLLDPSRTLRLFCRAAGLRDMPQTLTWNPLDIEPWKTWPKWHAAVRSSTEINSRYVSNHSLPAEFKELEKDCVAIYCEMWKERIR